MTSRNSRWWLCFAFDIWWTKGNQSGSCPEAFKVRMKATLRRTSLLNSTRFFAKLPLNFNEVVLNLCTAGLSTLTSKMEIRLSKFVWQSKILKVPIREERVKCLKWTCHEDIKMRHRQSCCSRKKQQNTIRMITNISRLFMHTYLVTYADLA